LTILLSCSTEDKHEHFRVFTPRVKENALRAIGRSLARQSLPSVVSGTLSTLSVAWMTKKSVRSLIIHGKILYTVVLIMRNYSRPNVPFAAVQSWKIWSKLWTNLFTRTASSVPLATVQSWIIFTNMRKSRTVQIAMQNVLLQNASHVKMQS